MGSNSHNSATERTLNHPDRTRLVIPTVAAMNHRSDAASVRSPATGHVRLQFRTPGTSLYSIGLCCPASDQSATSVQSSVRSRLLPSLLIRASGHFPPASGPTSGHLCELVSLRSYVRLGSYLHAWTLLDILVFSCAPKVLLMVLIIGSSCCLCPSHVLHPIGLQNNHLQIY